MPDQLFKFNGLAVRVTKWSQRYIIFSSLLYPHVVMWHYNIDPDEHDGGGDYVPPLVGMANKVESVSGDTKRPTKTLGKVKVKVK